MRTFNVKRGDEDVILVTDSRGSSAASADPDGSNLTFYQALGPALKANVERLVADFVKGKETAGSAAKEEAKRAEPNVKKRTFQPKNCRLARCGIEFAPKGTKQDYCCVEHRQEDKNPPQRQAKAKRTPLPARVAPSAAPAAGVEVADGIQMLFAGRFVEFEGVLKTDGGMVFTGALKRGDRGLEINGVVSGGAAA